MDTYPTDYAYELRLYISDTPVYIVAGNIDGSSEEFLVFVEVRRRLLGIPFTRLADTDMTDVVGDIVFMSFTACDAIKVISAPSFDANDTL